MSGSENTDQKPQDPDAPNPRLIQTIKEADDWFERLIPRDDLRDQTPRLDEGTT